MHRLNTAVFGTGFVGRVHLEGIRRVGYVHLYAIGEPEIEKAKKLADEFQVEKTEADYHKILDDPAVDAVHVCTPNALHFPMANAALEGRQARALREAPGDLDRGGAQAGRTGEGDEAPQLHLPQSALLPEWSSRCAACARPATWARSWCVQGTYSQDWLLYDTDWNWRIDSKDGGAVARAWRISARTGATWRST